MITRLKNYVQVRRTARAAIRRKIEGLAFTEREWDRITKPYR